MEQKAFEFMTQSEPGQESEVVLDEGTIEVLVELMAAALAEVVRAAEEVSDAE